MKVQDFHQFKKLVIKENTFFNLGKFERKYNPITSKAIPRMKKPKFTLKILRYPIKKQNVIAPKIDINTAYQSNFLSYLWDIKIAEISTIDIINIKNIHRFIFTLTDCQIKKDPTIKRIIAAIRIISIYGPFIRSHLTKIWDYIYINVIRKILGKIWAHRISPIHFDPDPQKEFLITGAD